MNAVMLSVIVIWVIVALVFALGAATVAIIGIVLLKKNKLFGGILLLCFGTLGVLALLGLIVLAGFLAYQMKDNPGFTETKVEDFNPDAYSGKMGTMSFPFKGESVLSETDDKKNLEIRYSSKDGVFKIPAGKHDFTSYELLTTDAKGNKWEASSWEITDFKDSLNVAEDANLDIQAGPPFTANITAKEKSDGTVYMSLQIKDKKGNSFSIYSPESSSSRSPVSFEVLSTSGEKLWSGEFKYG